MASKRMFAKCVIDTDAFCTLPLSARALYFHLSLVADDDGFIDSTMRTLRSVGASEQDLLDLVNARFMIPFDSGIYLVRHWFLNNEIKADRRKDTIYTKEQSMVGLIGKIYYLKTEPEWYQYGTDMDPQDRLEEDRKGKVSESVDQEKETDRGKMIPPTLEELSEYALSKNYTNFDPETFLAYYEASDWKNNDGKSYTNWKALVNLWVKREKLFPDRTKASKNSFTDHANQQTYDFDQLEKELLAN